MAEQSWAASIRSHCERVSIIRLVVALAENSKISWVSTEYRPKMLLGPRVSRM